MKYVLTAVVEGDDVKLRKSIFNSRDDAINYMFNYYKNHYIYGLQVEDVHFVGDNKHSVEYVCDYYNRFTVTRL